MKKIKKETESKQEEKPFVNKLIKRLLSGEQVRISGGKKNPNLETLRKLSKKGELVTFYLNRSVPIGVRITGSVSTSLMKVEFSGKTFEIRNYNPKNGQGYIKIFDSQYN